MKTQIIIQELVVFTDTSFAKRELYQYKDASRRELTACWSGWLFDMFPGICSQDDGKNMCVGKVNQAEQFIYIELVSASASTEFETSVGPYFFLPLVVCQN